MTRKLLLAMGLLLYAALVESADLMELIASKPELSQVDNIIKSDEVLSSLLKSKSYMAFLPNDKALSAYQGVKDSTLISYHLSNLPYLVQDMPDELNTDLVGNPRVYVSKVPSGQPSITGWEHLHVYINDAKVIDANHRAISSRGMKQVLHIVDRVITPTVPRGVDFSQIDLMYLNPDAQKLIEKPRYYGLEGPLSISEFEGRVNALNLHDVYNITGKNTFFIPVDTGINTVIDKQVIHGHVVPGKVLFTRTVKDSRDEYESLAFTDNLKVFISMENVSSSDNEDQYYVKSRTIASDVAHMKGTALARIVKGNIPIKNGVAHLIDRPLMLVATNVLAILQRTAQLSMFYDLIKNHNADLKNMMIVAKSLTVFAPSNEAFKKVNKRQLEQIQMNTEKISRLLRLHIVERILTTDELMDRNREPNLQVPTLNKGQNLYFAINFMDTESPVVTVEGAGVTGTLTTANVIARNGAVHIVDRLLGIPSQTVYEKLATDPILSATFNLSQQEGWNEKLKNRDERFTLFVPTNDAWADIRRTMPSAYKKLFMGLFAYHVRNILERHMIANSAFTLEDLLSLTTNATVSGKNIQQHRLNMTRGKVYFQARVTQSFGDSADENDTLIVVDMVKDGNTTGQTSSEYYTDWNGVRAKVIRPDLKCVNGVVHVIDKVMMMNRDVTVSGSAVPAASGLASLVATFFTVAFARALHH
ncbi:fasciclin-1-like isoform X4 [Portunus trituberculatus]|uniref:fasciclin-1-like isoform X4 n=1 Tax=Portunus trituberculatus TaxID=210409 RepID=UPI001E1D0D0C|nr:fasciclin-1-like isoform X4 [Portunus trituberculatus]